MAGRKRKSAPVAEDTGTASRRRSQRLSSSAQKSSYFEAQSDSDSAKDESASKVSQRRSRPSKKAKVEEYQTVEHVAEDSEDEFDEDAPPKVTFIPLPKLRDTGGVEYADDRLHPNTLAFLGDLKANNKRSWLKGMPITLSLPPLTIR